MRRIVAEEALVNDDELAELSQRYPAYITYVAQSVHRSFYLLTGRDMSEIGNKRMNKDINFGSEFVVAGFVQEVAPFVNLARIEDGLLKKVCDELDNACSKGGVIGCLRNFGHIIRSYTQMPRLMPARLTSQCLHLLERSGEDQNLVCTTELMRNILDDGIRIDDSTLTGLARQYPSYIAYVAQSLYRLMLTDIPAFKANSGK